MAQPPQPLPDWQRLGQALQALADELPRFQHLPVMAVQQIIRRLDELEDQVEQMRQQ